MAAGVADWITAVSTAVTGVFAGVAAWAAWRAVDYEKRRDLPVIDPNCAWVALPNGEEAIYVRLVMTNRTNQRLLVQEIDVHRPKNASFAFANRSRGGEMSLGEIQNPPIKAKISMEKSGTRDQITPIGWDSDQAQIEFYLMPNTGFVSSEIRLSVSFSSSALTIRDKRMTISMRIPPREYKSKDETTRRPVRAVLRSS